MCGASLPRRTHGHPESVLGRCRNDEESHAPGLDAGRRPSRHGRLHPKMSPMFNKAISGPYCSPMTSISLKYAVSPGDRTSALLDR